jgi:hypothetical protein
MKIEYTVPDQGDTFPGDAMLLGEFETKRQRIGIAKQEDGEYWAQECAEDYHNAHDGWEATWPVTIALYIDGDPAGLFEVDREAEPVFIARRKP